LKKRIKKNDLVNQACRKLKIQGKELFLAAREWANRTFGRRIKRGEAIAAHNAYVRTNHLIDWVKAFLNRNVFAQA
jgi:hypothetical protein